MKNPLGIPWWIWVGGGALMLYFTTRKAVVAAAAEAAPVPQVVDPEDPPVSGYVAAPMGCVGCL